MNGVLQKSSVCILSDQSAHGWYSAVPAYKQYIRVKKDQFRSRGKTIQKHIVFSDSGPTDIWTGPFMVFAIDICNEENVNLSLNRSASGHGKYIHDTLIGVMKRKIGYGWKEGLIYILPGQSPAHRTCIWLRSVYPTPDCKYNWEFVEVSPNDIRGNSSPTKRILTEDNKGIKTYHSLYANTDGIVKYRIFSCCCNTCISSNYDKCAEGVHVGEWVNCQIEEHPSYDSLPIRQIKRKRRRVSNDSNHNNR